MEQVGQVDWELDLARVKRVAAKGWTLSILSVTGEEFIVSIMEAQVLCESCGSIEVVRTRSSDFDKVVRWLTNRKRFTCRRCGWSALRDWHPQVGPATRPTPTLVKSDKKADSAA